jgi:hypothetical protein
VTNAPAGWDGPYALYDGAPAQDPGCPAEYPGTSHSFLGNGGLSAPPANCSVCTCANPQGQKCTMPNYVTVTDATCTGTATCGANLPLPANWDGSCTGNTYSGGNTCGPNADPQCQIGTGPCSVSVRALAPYVTGGSCAASPVIPDIPSLSWQRLGHGCGDAVSKTGCNPGQTCLPKTSTPFKLCAFKSGDNACPAGAYNEKHLLYEGVNDTRACDPCNCDPPAGGTCSATIRLYSDLQVGICNNQVVSFQAGTCVNLAGNPNVAGRRATISAVSGGTCQATGGSPTGTAVPANPTTFCCIP